jgi:hypothetical protein
MDLMKSGAVTNRRKETYRGKALTSYTLGTSTEQPFCGDCFCGRRGLPGAWNSILSMTQTSIPEPEPAKIRKSMTCALCSESVMESRIQQLHEKSACIPCYKMQQKFDQNASAGTDNPRR